MGDRFNLLKTKSKNIIFYFVYVDTINKKINFK